MSWLARVEAVTTQWPRPLRWAYLALKWYLVAVGAFVLGAMTMQRLGILPPFQ